MGHARATDIYETFCKGLEVLELKKLLQIGMDGPNTNWAFMQRIRESLEVNLFT